MPETKLNYYACDLYHFEVLTRVSKTDAEECCDVFFKADCIKTIRENCENIPGECAGITFVDDVEIGKKYKFKAGDPFLFTGLVKRGVLINEMKHLEIEIIADKLYFYILIDDNNRMDCFEIVEEVE